MTKKMILSSLLASTMLLGAATASADEVTAIDSSTPITEVTTNPATTPSTTVTEASTPTEPSVTPVTPVDPTTPDTSSTADKPQGKDNAESLDGVSTDKPTVPDTSSTTDKPQGKDNAESLDGVPAEKPKTTDQANQQGTSQIGTTSTATGQVVHDVTKNPIETNTGASIVSTQGGNIVLSDGSVVTPDVVGGTVNEDKTISVTDKDGNLKTLPNTGTAESILGTIGAMLLTAVGYFYKKKLF